MKAAKHGFFDPITRNFLTAEEKEESEKLNNMEEKIMSARDVQISKEQQTVMATDNDNDATIESNLTKDDAEPTDADDDDSDDTNTSNHDLSTLTGNTRESTRNAYEASEFNKVVT